MSVRRCMQEITPAEFRTWMLRLGREIGEPSRADHYVMLLTMEVRRLYKSQIKDSSPMSLKDFHLPVTMPGEPTDSPEENELTVTQASHLAKGAWAARIPTLKNNSNGNDS